MTRSRRWRWAPRLAATVALSLSLGACATCIAFPGPMGGTRTYLSVLEVCEPPKEVEGNDGWLLIGLIFVPPLLVVDVFVSLGVDVALLPLTGPIAILRHASEPHPEPPPAPPPVARARVSPARDVDAPTEPPVVYSSGPPSLTLRSGATEVPRTVTVASIGRDGSAACSFAGERRVLAGGETYFDGYAASAVAIESGTVVAASGSSVLAWVPGMGRGHGRIFTTGAGSPVTALALRADGARAFAGHGSGALGVFGFVGEQTSFVAHVGSITAIAPVGDDRVVTASATEVRRWQLRGRPRDEATWPVRAPVSALAATGDLVLAGLSDGAVELLAPPGLAGNLRRASGSSIVAVALADDGSAAAWATADGEVVAFDLLAWAPIGDPLRPPTRARALSLAPGFGPWGGDVLLVRPTGERSRVRVPVVADEPTPAAAAPPAAAGPRPAARPRGSGARKAPCLTCGEPRGSESPCPHCGSE